MPLAYWFWLLVVLSLLLRVLSLLVRQPPWAQATDETSYLMILLCIVLLGLGTFGHLIK